MTLLSEICCWLTEKCSLSGNSLMSSREFSMTNKSWKSCISKKNLTLKSLSAMPFTPSTQTTPSHLTRRSKSRSKTFSTFCLRPTRVLREESWLSWIWCRYSSSGEWWSSPVIFIWFAIIGKLSWARRNSLLTYSMATSTNWLLKTSKPSMPFWKSPPTYPSKGRRIFFRTLTLQGLL